MPINYKPGSSASSLSASYMSAVLRFSSFPAAFAFSVPSMPVCPSTHAKEIFFHSTLICCVWSWIFHYGFVVVYYP